MNKFYTLSLSIICFILSISLAQSELKFSDGSHWSGEVLNQMAHGEGTYTWVNGDRYVGAMVKNVRHGKGKYYWRNGETYDGDWKDNYQHGYGTYHFANGDVYIGNFSENLRDGYGTYTYSNGDKYAGEIEANHFHGRGKMTYARGIIVDGQFEKNNPVYGTTIIYPNNDRYVGNFDTLIPNGEGTYTFANGEVFSGVWDKFGVLDKKLECTLRGCTKLKSYDLAKNEEKLKKEIEQQIKTAKENLKKETEAAREQIKKERAELDRQKKKKYQNIKTKPRNNTLFPVGSGSSFSVSNKGYLVTNNHVIEGCQTVTVQTNKKDLEAKVIAYDRTNDLALLKADFSPTTFFGLSNRSPEILEEIYVAGFPFGYKVSKSVKVTKGIISSLAGIGNNFSHIQIDAALQPGNSGGPILDEKGNLIAVAVAKLDMMKAVEDYGVVPENVNFGIKTSIVKNLLLSHSIAIPKPNTSKIKKTYLGNKITKGTFHLSCWMTEARYKEMTTKKVLFKNVNFQSK